MRTTLDIDDDILSAAKDLARADKKTVGQVISDLARKALTAPELASLDERGQPKLSRWPTLPRRGGIVTSEMVKRIQEEIDLEDAMRFSHPLEEPQTSRTGPGKQRGGKRRSPVSRGRRSR
jgi:hypothetical protein